MLERTEGWHSTSCSIRRLLGKTRILSASESEKHFPRREGPPGGFFLSLPKLPSVPMFPQFFLICSLLNISASHSDTIKILTIFFFVPLFPETSGRPSKYGVYNPPLPLQNICSDKGLQLRHYNFGSSWVSSEERVNHPQKMSSSDVINSQDLNYRGLRWNILSISSELVNLGLDCINLAAKSSHWLEGFRVQGDKDHISTAIILVLCFLEVRVVSLFPHTAVSSRVYVLSR